MKFLSLGSFSKVIFGACFLACGTISNAAIIYSGPRDLTVSESTGSSLSINMGGVSDSFQIVSTRGAFVLRHPVDTGSYWTLNNSLGRLLDVDYGTLISQEQQWFRVMSEIGMFSFEESNQWFGMDTIYDAPDRYMPLRILNNEDVLFGWLRLSHDAQAGVLTVHDWAWNSASGQPILAGEIPEPAAAALLTGLALLALAALRRRHVLPLLAVRPTCRRV